MWATLGQVIMQSAGKGDLLVPRNWSRIRHRTKCVSARCHRGEHLASLGHLATEPGRWAIVCLSVLSSHCPPAIAQQSLLPADIWQLHWEAIAGCYYLAAGRCLFPEDQHAATPWMPRWHSCRRSWLWSPRFWPFLAVASSLRALAAIPRGLLHETTMPQGQSGPARILCVRFGVQWETVFLGGKVTSLNGQMLRLSVAWPPEQLSKA